jgi:hypothetical protein
VILRSWPSINFVTDCGVTPESLSTMVLTRSVALKSPRNESKKVENGKIAKRPL